MQIKALGLLIASALLITGCSRYQQNAANTQPKPVEPTSGLIQIQDQPTDITIEFSLHAKNGKLAISFEKIITYIDKTERTNLPNTIVVLTLLDGTNTNFTTDSAGTAETILLDRQLELDGPKRLVVSIPTENFSTELTPAKLRPLVEEGLCIQRNDFAYCGELALRYFACSNPQRSEELASKYAQIACEHRDNTGCLVLADLLLGGEAIQQNVQKAIELMRSSCDSGARLGCIRLVLTTLSPCLSTSFPPDSIDAWVEELPCWRAGLYSVSAEQSAANDYPRLGIWAAQRSCDLGDATGCRLLSVMYVFGAFVDRNLNRAEELANRSVTLETANNQVGSDRQVSLDWLDSVRHLKRGANLTPAAIRTKWKALTEAQFNDYLREYLPVIVTWSGRVSDVVEEGDECTVNVSVDGAGSPRNPPYIVVSFSLRRSDAISLSRGQRIKFDAIITNFYTSYLLKTIRPELIAARLLSR